MLKPIMPAIRNHHERWDGKGYPDGLKGDEIPLASRIVLVCDAFHAMTSDRPYRDGLSMTRLEEILKDGAGVQWDRNVVAAYFSIRDDVRRICASYSPSDGNLLDSPAPAAPSVAASGNPLNSIEQISAALQLADKL